MRRKLANLFIVTSINRLTDFFVPGFVTAILKKDNTAFVLTYRVLIVASPRPKCSSRTRLTWLKFKENSFTDYKTNHSCFMLHKMCVEILPNSVFFTDVLIFIFCLLRMNKNNGIFTTIAVFTDNKTWVGNGSSKNKRFLKSCNYPSVISKALRMSFKHWFLRY